uniref:General transcription factor IIH subunit 1-like n=1 Tax=Lepisosteus oculatus TaxID=7918 RepID=W5MIN1_LEPOC|nr:PREDICTED: general transcription factor IIH subunit 1-like [Lepisosteus oculatus]
MLQEDPVLFQLYKDLVVSQVISAEEFWANRLSLTSVDHSLASSKQEVGISAAFLADVRPQTDGCNGLRYNLTADIIESIFRTYPAGTAQTTPPPSCLPGGLGAVCRPRSQEVLGGGGGVLRVLSGGANSCRTGGIRWMEILPDKLNLKDWNYFCRILCGAQTFLLYKKCL